MSSETFSQEVYETGMNSINISLDQVAESADKIASINQQMYESLTAMKREMNSLDGSWISDAGEAIRARFNAFANRFENQRTTIDAYVKFLHMTVQTYDTTEGTIVANAESAQE